MLAVHVVAVWGICRYVGVPSRSDIGFVLVASVYALLANRYAPKESLMSTERLINPPAIVRRLFPVTLMLSVVLPWTIITRERSMILGSASETMPSEIDPGMLSRIIAPHLFLVHSQLFVETVSFMNALRLTAYVRVFIPICFTFYRLSSTVQWFQAASALPPMPGLKGLVGLTQFAALANIVYWVLALFGFLLPMVVPSFFSTPSSQCGTAGRSTSVFDSPPLGSTNTPSAVVTSSAVSEGAVSRRAVSQR